NGYVAALRQRAEIPDPAADPSLGPVHVDPVIAAIAESGGGWSIHVADTLIPGYRIKKWLGGGSQANVYLAIQEGTEGKVAIKVIRPDAKRPGWRAGQADWEMRFRREAAIAAQVESAKHAKRFVRIYHTGRGAKVPEYKDPLSFIVMQYVEGRSLRSRI